MQCNVHSRYCLQLQLHPNSNLAAYISILMLVEMLVIVLLVVDLVMLAGCDDAGPGPGYAGFGGCRFWICLC